MLGLGSFLGCFGCLGFDRFLLLGCGCFGGLLANELFVVFVGLLFDILLMGPLGTLLFANQHLAVLARFLLMVDLLTMSSCPDTSLFFALCSHTTLGTLL